MTLGLYKVKISHYQQAAGAKYILPVYSVCDFSPEDKKHQHPSPVSNSSIIPAKPQAGPAGPIWVKSALWFSSSFRERTKIFFFLLFRVVFQLETSCRFWRVKRGFRKKLCCVQDSFGFDKDFSSFSVESWVQRSHI